MHTMLIVDDEAIERAGVRYLIERGELDIRIVEASNGEDAKAILDAQPVDILFTDIVMPRLDGLQLAEYASSRHPEMIVLVYSGYGEFEYAQKAIQCRVMSYILKPLNEKTFLEVMQKAIRQCEETRVRTRAAALTRRALGKAREQLLWQVLLGKVDPDDALLRQSFPFHKALLMLARFRESFLARTDSGVEACLREGFPNIVSLTLSDKEIVLFLPIEKELEDSRTLSEQVWRTLREFAEANGQTQFFAASGGAILFPAEAAAAFAHAQNALEQGFYLCESALLFPLEQMPNQDKADI